MVSLSRRQVNQMFLDACAGYESIRDAWMNGVDVRSSRANIIEANIPIAAIMASAFNDKGNFSCEYDDIFQSASVGLIEAVDLYQPLESPDEGSFGGYARFRIYKNMVTEWERSHWRSMKPSRSEHRKWFAGRVSGDEADAYYEKYLLALSDDHDDDGGWMSRGGLDGH